MVQDMFTTHGVCIFNCPLTSPTTSIRMPKREKEEYDSPAQETDWPAQEEDQRPAPENIMPWPHDMSSR